MITISRCRFCNARIILIPLDNSPKSADSHRDAAHSSVLINYDSISEDEHKRILKLKTFRYNKYHHVLHNLTCTDLPIRRILRKNSFIQLKPKLFIRY